MADEPNGRIDKVLKMLKNGIAYSELILFNHEDGWRFERKIPVHEFGLVADNDDTLTTAGKKNRSWIVLNAALRSMGSDANIAYADEIEKIRKKYRKIEENSGFLTAEQMHEWHKANLRIFMQSGLTYEVIENQVNCDAEIYPEAIDLLKYLLDGGATVCIVSAGIAEIIKLSLKKHGIDPSKYKNLKIFAIELMFSHCGELSGYYPPTIVTLENKGPLAKSFMTERGILDKNVTGLGDGLTDAQMLYTFSERASMVLFCPAHKIGDLTVGSFRKMSGQVHAVIKKDFGIFTKKIKEMTV